MTILALDVGSSSVRAIFFEAVNDKLQIIPDTTIQYHHDFKTDATGRTTANPEELRTLLEKCLEQALAHPAAQQLEAIGMDCFVSNVLAVDSNRNAISDLVTYADTRGRKYLDDLVNHIDIDKKHKQTGAPFHTAYYPAQLPLIQSDEVLQFMDFGTYCYRKWFGQGVPMSYSTASWSGILNRKALDWDNEYLQVMGVDKVQLPKLTDYTNAMRGYDGIPDVPFYLAVGDGASAQVGSNAISDNTAALTVGTTAALRYVSTDHLPDVPHACWSYRIDESHHLLGGALSEGGNIFQWAVNTLKLDLSKIQQELAQREAGSHGLTVLPMFNGERSTGWHADATGTIHGLRLSTDPIDIVHALLESVALRIAIIAQQLGLPKDTTIMGSGGALHASDVWTQMIADALGMPIHLLDEPEVTALGTAQLAYCALHGEAIRGASPRIEKTIKPDKANNEKYQKLIEEQKALYNRLFDS